MHTYIHGRNAKYTTLRTYISLTSLLDPMLDFRMELYPSTTMTVLSMYVWSLLAWEPSLALTFKFKLMLLFFFDRERRRRSADSLRCCEVIFAWVCSIINSSCSVPDVGVGVWVGRICFFAEDDVAGI